jgi:hypothetical protein
VRARRYRMIAGIYLSGGLIVLIVILLIIYLLVRR